MVVVVVVAVAIMIRYQHPLVSTVTARSADFDLLVSKGQVSAGADKLWRGGPLKKGGLKQTDGFFLATYAGPGVCRPRRAHVEKPDPTKSTQSSAQTTKNPGQRLPARRWPLICWGDQV